MDDARTRKLTPAMLKMLADVRDRPRWESAWNSTLQALRRRGLVTHGSLTSSRFHWCITDEGIFLLASHENAHRPSETHDGR